MKQFHLPIKTAAVAMAAAVYMPLVADWCAPTFGLHRAVTILQAAARGVKDDTVPLLWAALVREIGRDIQGLSTLSMLAALGCVALLAWIVGDLFGFVVGKGKKLGAVGEGEFSGVRSSAILLTVAAFVFTPGFLRAATQMGPLMSLFLPVFTAAFLLTHFLTHLKGKFLLRLKKGWWTFFFFMASIAYSAWVWIPSRRIGLMAFFSVLCFLFIGVFPSLALADLVRRRIVVARRRQLVFFCGWTLAIAISATVALLDFDRERAASRFAQRALDNAKGCKAILSDGVLDDVFYFMLPENQACLAFSRDADPAYGRELADWVEGVVSGKSLRENLVFAAELGPCALADEWNELDPTGFRATVRAPAFYFPTVESWRAACAELNEKGEGGVFDAQLRRLLGVCGNQFGCSFLEKGRNPEAWSIFWEILDSVDSANYAALINLSGMVERGCAASKDALDKLKRLRDLAERRYATPRRRMFAARAGGRLYVDPRLREARQKARQEAIARDEISPQAKEFLSTVSAAPRDRAHAEAAREAIRKGLSDGLVRIKTIGLQLLELDRMLGDWESAEKDAIAVLRVDRRHLEANAIMGMLAAQRGDFETAERYLKRGIRDQGLGIEGPSWAYNDLAFVLLQRGRTAEALNAAQEAVRRAPDDWNFRETLAIVLIRNDKPEEGLAELRRAEEMADKAGVRRAEIVRFELDRAWLYRARGENGRLKYVLRVLGARSDLTDLQRNEIREIER